MMLKPIGSLCNLNCAYCYYLDKEKKDTDDALYAEFKTQKDFDNYDAFLQYKLGPAYDDLEFKEVQKILNINNAVCKYCDGSG